jgi:ribose transport system substrate-binding protein
MAALKRRNMLLFLIIAVLLAAAAVYEAKIYHVSDASPEITVVIKSTEASMEFWQVLSDGVRVAAREFGVTVHITGPPNESDIEGQIKILDEAIQRRPSAIIMAATDVERLVPVASRIRESGIALLTVDSGIHSDLPVSFIATDNVEAGRKAGAAMAGLLQGPSKVAIISFVQGTATQIDREQGVRQELKGHSDIDILGTYYSNGVEEKAYEITKQLLTEHPDLSGIVGLNETSTVGAGRAIEELQLIGRVKLVGFDNSIDEVKLLEAGVMQVTVIQKPFNMGYLSVKTAVEAIRGQEVPARIDTGSVVITKQNMYTDENQKLLFPFVDQ